MKAKNFDRKFDSGGKILDQVDLSKARRVGTDAKRVNVDFPAWMVLTSLALAPEAIRINEASAARANEPSCIVSHFIAVLERLPLPPAGPNFRR